MIARSAPWQYSRRTERIGSPQEQAQVAIERDTFKLLMGRLTANIDDDRRALFILHLATISALIDAGVLTADRTIEQIIRVQAALPPKYKGERINRQLETAIRFLTDYGTPPSPDADHGVDDVQLNAPDGTVIRSDPPPDSGRD